MHLELISALSGILVCGGATEIRPINLPLCEETRENVSKFFTDVYVVKSQQYNSCHLTNTSTPVVSKASYSYNILGAQRNPSCPARLNCKYVHDWFNFLFAQMFRVTTSALETNLSNPVVFVARSERYVQTWRIPLELPQ